MKRNDALFAQTHLNAGGDGSLRRLVNRLAELDQIDHATARLRETKRGWKVLASAA